VAAVAACLALILAGPGASEPTWTAPVTLVAGSNPRVAVNAAGDAVVGFGVVSLTKTISRTHGTAHWTEPVTLAEGASPPNVALDEAGDAFAIFTKGRWPNTNFQAAVRDGVEGVWQDAVTISPQPETGVLAPGRVAVDAAGDAVAVFDRWSGNGYVIQAAVRPASSGRWQQIVDLSDPNGNSPRGAAVAIDKAGNAVALWARAGHGAESPVIVSAFRPANGAWTAPVEVGGPYGDVWEIQASFDPAGNAVAVWRVTLGNGHAVYSSYRAFGGSWTAPAMVAQSRWVDDISLTVDDSGDALATWIEARGEGRWGVSAASRPAASGRWQPPAQVTPSMLSAVGGAASTSDRSGNAVAVWTDGGDATVHAALRPAASAAWEPPVEIATGASYGDVGVAIDERDDAVAVWEAAAGSGHVIEAGELKAGGPVLQLEVPARGAAGTPTRFRVTPSPWGSPLVGEPDWDFGDGGSARGASVVHTYRRTGTYTVTVVQSDAAGRNSGSTATIIVGRATLANRSRPVIAGAPRVGATLRCRPGSWTGSQPIRFRYAWLRGGRPIGAGPRYRARSHDAGALLSCRVTATNGPLTRAATSRPVRIRG
jgi:hypothetical protein